MARIKYRHLAGEPDGRTRHKRLGLRNAYFIDGLACTKIIGAIHNNIHPGKQLPQTISIYPLDDCFHYAIGIDLRNGSEADSALLWPIRAVVWII